MLNSLQFLRLLIMPAGFQFKQFATFDLFSTWFWKLWELWIAWPQEASHTCFSKFRCELVDSGHLSCILGTSIQALTCCVNCSRLPPLLAVCFEASTPQALAGTPDSPHHAIIPGHESLEQPRSSLSGWQSLHCVWPRVQAWSRVHFGGVLDETAQTKLTRASETGEDAQSHGLGSGSGWRQRLRRDAGRASVRISSGSKDSDSGGLWSPATVPRFPFWRGVPGAGYEGISCRIPDSERGMLIRALARGSPVSRQLGLGIAGRRCSVVGSSPQLRRRGPARPRRQPRQRARNALHGFK